MSHSLFRGGLHNLRDIEWDSANKQHLFRACAWELHWKELPVEQLLRCGEVAQWLGALRALAGEPGLIPSIYMAAHNHLNSRSRASDDLYWLPWAADNKCGAHMYMQAKHSYT